MISMMSQMTPKIAIGAAIYREKGKDLACDLLLVQRAHAPGQALWALPGGHLNWGESLADALRREIAEELNISIHIGPLIYVAEILGEDHHFVVLDYAAMVDAGQPTAASDASDYRWVNASEILLLPLAPGMREFLANALVRQTLHWDPV